MFAQFGVWINRTASILRDADSQIVSGDVSGDGASGHDTGCKQFRGSAFDQCAAIFQQLGLGFAYQLGDCGFVGFH
ncbi:hypothetical protein D3C71_1959720 [compost metagenome]